MTDDTVRTVVLQPSNGGAGGPAPAEQGVEPAGTGGGGGALFRSPSLRVIGKRLLSAIPVLWGVTFLTFSVMNLLPGDAAQSLLGQGATPAQVHALALRLHLDEPFFTRYGHWLGGLVTGDLGSSLTGSESVVSILASRLPVTAELVAYAFVISLVFAIPAGMLAARKPGGIADRLSMAVSMISLSTASFVVGLLLILVFAVKLGWFPAIGYDPISQGIGSNLRSLTLPAVAVAFPRFGSYTRLLRADLVEQMLSEDYVLIAKAKGGSPWRVLSRHAMRNSVFGLITLVGLNLGTMVGATVIIEEIFALPGLGQELLQAIDNRDVVVVEGIVLVFAAAVVVANLLTDLLYSVLDPRIRYGNSAN